MTETPSTWKYVGVWLLVSFIVHIATSILLAVIFFDVNSPDDVLSALVVGIPLEAIAIAIVIITVYSVFTSLDMSAVFPWMVGLVSLSVLMGLADMASLEFVPSWLFAYQIACTAGMLFGIRVFFQSTGRITKGRAT
jgi:hypothetical protein